MLSALILFILAIGSVKGFAFTLGLTTVIDVLVVFFFTKPLMTAAGPDPVLRRRPPAVRSGPGPPRGHAPARVAHAGGPPAAARASDRGRRS